MKCFAPAARIVYVPVGTFLTGGLELKSRVTLYLEAGAVLLGSPSIDDYEYHPGPVAHSDANGCHLIFAKDADDVTICGPGTIDGQGEAYWKADQLDAQTGRYVERRGLGALCGYEWKISALRL